MRKLILIPIIIAIIITVLFCILLTANFVLYKTWGNNENYYVTSGGLEIECDINLLRPPTNCRPIISDNSFPYPEKGSITIESELTIDGMISNFRSNVLYVEQNVNHGFTEREYSAVMRLANSDLDRAIEIFNDPDYPEKFYDETGYLP